MSRSPPNRRRQNQTALVLRFALSFFALVLLFSALSRVDEALFSGVAAGALTHSVARVAASILALFGAPAKAEGGTVVYGAATFQIIKECTAIELVGLFTSGVLAFPSRWRYKFLGLAVGIPVLMILNLIRVMTLVYAGAAWPEALEYGHSEVMPVLFLTISLGMWLSWARIADRDHRILV